MVGNFWNESIYPKIKQAEEFSSDQFYKSQWQTKTGVSVYYLVYRWITAILFLVYSIASIFEIDPLSRPSLVYPKYPIYLTNWVVWISCMQALLVTGIVTYPYITLRNQKEGVQNEENIAVKYTIKMYWATQTIALVMSISISVMFWVAVYHPEINPLNAFTLASHGIMAVYLVVDALIVAHPFRIIDFVWVFLFIIGYFTFSGVYYLIGGTDRFGRNFIYSILDWEFPANAFFTCMLVVLFCLFVHLVVWSLSYSTRKLAYYWFNKDSKPKIETVIDIIDTEAPPTGTNGLVQSHQIL